LALRCPSFRLKEVGLDAREDEALAILIEWHRRNEPDEIALADDAMPRKFAVEFKVFLPPRRILGEGEVVNVNAKPCRAAGVRVG
jgi:hypothetical protein